MNEYIHSDSSDQSYSSSSQDQLIHSKFNPIPKIIKSSKTIHNEDELKVEIETGIEILFENMHDLIEFCEYSK